MNLGFTDKVYLVSGSSRGIGKGIAAGLLEEGARVVLTGRDLETLETTRGELAAVGEERVIAVQGDLNRDDTLSSVEQRALQRWGRIDGVVANAGAVKPVEPWQIPDEDWEWYFEANFKISYRFVARFIPHLIKSRGSVVFIGSIAGIEEIGAPLPYSTAKAAVSMYAKGLARTLAGDGVRVNVINPGNVYFEGGNWDRRMREDPDTTRRLIEQRVPMNGFASPEDIAAATLFLLSDKAKFVTGSSLTVDGGQTSLFI